MATHNYTSEVSDGEIVEDFPQIEDFELISSEDDIDYFEKVDRRVSHSLALVNRRKIELELANTLAIDFGKENYHSKLSNRKRPSARKRKLSNKTPSGSRYESSREVARNRSYRASSVFSNYSIRKRQKRETTRSSRKEKEKRLKREYTDLSESEKGEGDSEDDEELLTLRLKALKSKQEVKELIEGENQQRPQSLEPTEEENLRILALKSAVLKKKEFFKERKKQKMLENERPYSPSDVLPDMDMSPLGSPFNEISMDNQEVDMEISNDEKETSDMDLAPSPQQVEIVNDEEEIALRSLLLTSIHKKKDDVEVEKSPEDSSGTEQVMLAQSLKMVVQRLKQKKAQEVPPVVSIPVKSSGTKTIAEILAEQKGKKKRSAINLIDKKVSLEKKLKLEEAQLKKVQAPPEKVHVHPESQRRDRSFLIRTIVNDIPPEIVQLPVVNLQPNSPPSPKDLETQPPSPQHAIEIQPASPHDASFSTITDTKNIPLIPLTDPAKKSRLVTSLENVIKPVPRLIIPVRSDETDTDEELKPPVKKTMRKVIKPTAKPKPAAQPEFEKNLESFLKNIRKEQEKKSETGVPKSSSSNVKHLPKSAQLEYEQLIEKLKVLEEAKRKTLRARQLKQTKSNPEQMQAPTIKIPTKVPSPKKQMSTVAGKPAKKTKDTIADSLSKIPQLDEGAQQRFMEKTENNYKNHSDKLMIATKHNLKLLEDNEVDLKKQEKLATKIVELEKLLKTYKTNLINVNQRVKVNVHKIVQSSREMTKLRVHQKNFGKHICLPAGIIIKGEGYSLPENQTVELDETFIVIATKTEDIIKASSDANVNASMKIIADKVRSFVTISKPVEVVGDQQSAKDEQSSSVPENTLKSIDDTTPTPASDDEESAVMKMIKEDSENPATESEVPVNIAFPDIQKKMKGILDGEGSKRIETITSESDQSVTKKLKYESPLDFLRVPKNKYGS